MAAPEQLQIPSSNPTSPGVKSPTSPGVFEGFEAGETSHQDKWGKVHISNPAGRARSYITLHAKWDVPPEVVFAIFSYPDNSKLFRDMSRVGHRNVVKTEPGIKVVEVEQLAEMRILWIRRTYSTWLRVTEDTRDPKCLITEFELLKSDVLERFHGKWHLRPLLDGAGAVVGTEAELQQDVCPRGIPSFVRSLPLMSGLLRSATLRSIQRVVEDLTAATVKVKAGMAKGKTVEEVMRELCGSCQEQGFANGKVKSHAFSVDDDEEEEAAGGAEEGKDQANDEKQLSDQLQQTQLSAGQPPASSGSDGAKAASAGQQPSYAVAVSAQ